MSDSHDHVAETLRAWDLAAGKYADAIDADVAAILAGALDLSPPERDVLLPLVTGSTRLLHLQCSHGQTALRDLTRWGEVVAELLAPNGSLVLYEGHPLNWVWDPRAAAVQFRTGRSYFDAQAEPNDDFPARAAERFSPTGAPVPRAWEHQLTLGQVVTAVATAGLRIARLVEYPAHFWPEFPHVPLPELVRLPHSFLLVARQHTRPKLTVHERNRASVRPALRE